MPISSQLDLILALPLGRLALALAIGGIMLAAGVAAHLIERRRP